MGTAPMKAANLPPCAIQLTEEELPIFRDFCTAGRTIEWGTKVYLKLAIKVKAIFAAKPRGVPIAFAGCLYYTFDEFVDANFPVCARTMRNYLAEEGLTDQRFTNKPDEPMPELTTAVVDPPASPELSAPVVAEPHPAAAEPPVMEPEPLPPAVEPQPQPVKPAELRKIKSLLGVPSHQVLPPLVLHAYQVGFTEGYACGHANGTAEMLDGDYGDDPTHENSGQQSIGE